MPCIVLDIDKLMAAPMNPRPCHLNGPPKTKIQFSSPLTNKKQDRLKCPRCGKEDFDSKAIYNSHARNCKREPGTPKNKKKINPSPGFGRMGLLLQIRRLQEEEERKKAEALEQKLKEE